ncbi:mRNA-decapping enzyme-like protein isoform X2 [Phragmites australis]|uniref:mRNA-decapping enzyme-like protein isoform X2 n=1 Tax=Phragmites australis TaxID=29695 RepID=UPI002D78398A|nr:mRNA-decapping enzyme-like protein isoform X2 [Phragmites australis]
MAHGGGGGRAKVTPNLAMDGEGTRTLNLTVLQRLDPSVEDILITAAHVTLYDFDTDINQWSRKDVEGSLFVVKRNAQPRFQFIVMNRRNTDNLVEDLLGDFEYQLQVPYIMYRNAAQEVIGIWFYNSQECQEVANLFSRILNAFSKVPPKPKIPSIESEYEELEAAPALVEGPLEPPTSNIISTTTHVQEDPLSAFFSAAANAGGSSGVVVAGQPNQSFSATPLSTHAPTSITTSQSPALHHLLPSQTSSASGIPTDVHGGTGPIVRSTNLVNPSLFSPLTSSQTTMVPGNYVVPTAPPQHPRTTQQPQSAPLLHPFPLPTASPSPPYGTPLLQPFPPPNPSPSLASAPVYPPVLSRDIVRDALLRLVQNDEFIDLVYQEIVNNN